MTHAHYDDESEQVKEVYARFGLAVYSGQVLEHGIVNSLVVLDLIPNRRHRARSANEWGSLVDEFMSRHFEKTMGRMLHELRSLTTVPADLETLLIDALKRRNRLAHDFFREHAENFMNTTGRSLMLAEVDECRAVLRDADARLEEVVAPLRIAAGLTDELIERAFRQMKAEARDAG